MLEIYAEQRVDKVDRQLRVGKKEWREAGQLWSNFDSLTQDLNCVLVKNCLVLLMNVNY
jgi:hypothetical protein